MFRGVDGVFWEVVVVVVVEVVSCGCGFIDEAWEPGTVRARKAEKKEAKKGREGGWVGIVSK